VKCGALGATFATIAALVSAGCGGGSDYTVTLDLANAGGLRTGSLVQVGGVPVGKVAHLDLQHDDRVRATLDLDSGRGPIGRDARVAIASRNLLGEKYVNLTPGNRSRPLLSGGTLPAARVQPSVDLDQILDVLTPTTRAKVSLLIDQAGAGLAGRGDDLNAFLRQFPPTLNKATALLDQVVTDNHTLGQVIERSDRFIGTLNRQRQELARLVGTAGDAADTFAAKRAQLTATLDRAPGTLTQLRRTLIEVRQTAAPLGQAARAATASTPALNDTLAAVEPFRQAAVPALDQLQAAAPRLSRLGREATPVVRRAVTTLASLHRFGTTIAPVSRTLDVMIDDLMAALHGWSRAIQVRDGLSHMFRAKVAINPESLNAIISRLSQPTAKKKQTRPATPKLPKLLPKPSASTTNPGATKPLPGVGSAVGNPGDTVGGVATGLLDYLLGK
jgi:virulence factor Mce-like protein